MPAAPTARRAPELVQVALRLRRAVSPLRFSPPVTHVYNPLDYAWAPHRLYLQRYGRPGVEVLLVGMNPGPWGMAQTGVPFGEVRLVREWLRIEAPVRKPRREHPRRPVLGFACARREVSGQRVWGWAQARFGTPERFFRRFFVWAYCPSSFMERSGRNRTPDKLPAKERAPLFAACDRALRDVTLYLRPRLVVGMGGFATRRAWIALAGLDVRIGQILHPSPQSPAANRGWAPQVEAELRRLQVTLPGAGLQ